MGDPSPDPALYLAQLSTVTDKFKCITGVQKFFSFNINLPCIGYQRTGPLNIQVRSRPDRIQIQNILTFGNIENKINYTQERGYNFQCLQNPQGNLSTPLSGDTVPTYVIDPVKSIIFCILLGDCRKISMLRMFFPDPYFYLSEIPSLGIPDPTTATKEKGKNKFMSSLFCSHKFT